MLCKCIQVIAVDLRNHGDSPHDAEMDYHVMTDDVEQLARGTLNLEKVAVIGHSMGGKVAMMLALTSVCSDVVTHRSTDRPLGIKGSHLALCGRCDPLIPRGRHVSCCILCHV